METDAHYYAVMAFARACGFKKEIAQSIALASQSVDDSTINYLIVDGPIPRITCDTIDNKPCFFNVATCHSYEKIRTFNYNAMVRNTTPFHFVPGCQGNTYAQLLRCKEESPVIVKILEESFKTDDPVRFGMVLHAYADTFSHQGFSGILEIVNDITDCQAHSPVPWDLMDGIKSVLGFFSKKNADKFMDFVPAYGHAQALDYPDLPHLTWSYRYDYTDEFSGDFQHSGNLDNKDRFTRAFQKIRGHLNTYLDLYPHHRDTSVSFNNFNALFNALIQRKTLNGRMDNWRKVLKDTGLLKETDPGFNYDEFAWLKAAFSNFDQKKFSERMVDGVKLCPGFENSNWYKFYLNVRWYEDLFYKTCRENGLTIMV